MSTIRLTAKRQATFPKALCEELNVQPGDSLVVQRSSIEGEDVWVLRPADRSIAEVCSGQEARYALDP